MLYVDAVQLTALGVNVGKLICEPGIMRFSVLGTMLMPLERSKYPNALRDHAFL
jgi:hypothetical protein